MMITEIVLGLGYKTNRNEWTEAIVYLNNWHVLLRYRCINFFIWLVRGAGIEPARPRARDFKSLMSTNSITRAYMVGLVRLERTT